MNYLDCNLLKYNTISKENFQLLKNINNRFLSFDEFDRL